MFKTLKNAFQNKEIRIKILIVLGLLVLFRLGCWIPVPGISSEAFKTSVDNQTFLSLLSGITGGALSNGAILALGVSPYITAQIVVQLLSMAIPAWERLSKQGEEGRKKLNKYTKILTLILATAQAIGIVVSFSNAGAINSGLFGGAEWLTGAVVVITLVAGAMFTMWLGEKITETGIANGLSLLIFVGILSTAGTAIFNNIVESTSDPNKLWQLLAFVVAL
ncbi:MAG: preprotein translocase subunit SecY, partial [Clostridia bacterium]|nr:preprotein translocase subunit SecY [Clostridia bacterium]